MSDADRFTEPAALRRRIWRAPEVIRDGTAMKILHGHYPGEAALRGQSGLTESTCAFVIRAFLLALLDVEERGPFTEKYDERPSWGGRDWHPPLASAPYMQRHLKTRLAARECARSWLLTGDGAAIADRLGIDVEAALAAMHERCKREAP